MLFFSLISEFQPKVTDAKVFNKYPRCVLTLRMHDSRRASGAPEWIDMHHGRAVSKELPAYAVAVGSSPAYASFFFDLELEGGTTTYEW